MSNNNNGKVEINMDIETINKVVSTIKWIWGLILGTFLLGAAANYQLLTARFENEKRDSRITHIETSVIKKWDSLMITDLTLATHETNRYALLSEKELRQLVDDIYCRYSR